MGEGVGCRDRFTVKTNRKSLKALIAVETNRKKILWTEAITYIHSANSRTEASRLKPCTR